jgi:hypothetical protein
MALPETIVGCTLEEIHMIKEQQQVLYLPPIYEEFLKTMGRKAGKWLEGSDCFYPDLLDIKHSAIDLLHENDDPYYLPDDAFVVLMHQGYQFMYFRTTDMNQDPPVQYYTEIVALRSSMPQVQFGRLSEYLTEFIRESRGRDAQQRFLSEHNLL